MVMYLLMYSIGTSSTIGGGKTGREASYECHCVVVVELRTAGWVEMESFYE